MTKGTNSLLSVIQDQIEPSIIAHGQNLGIHPPGWKRPFVDTTSRKRDPIEKNLHETVTFPEKDESTGEMFITYLGPEPSAFLERKVRQLVTLSNSVNLMRSQGTRYLGHLSDFISGSSFE